MILSTFELIGLFTASSITTYLIVHIVLWILNVDEKTKKVKTLEMRVKRLESKIE